MKTTERVLRSGRKVKVEIAPPAPEVKFEEKRKPYRKVDEHYIFGPGGDIYFRKIPPEPSPPIVPDALDLGKIPWDQVQELAQEYPQRKKNPDGVSFAGVHVRLRMADGTILEGWLPDSAHKAFRHEIAVRGMKG